ncbi:MAG: MATE family efflux transporter, partial [Dehalococcoidales bacterium]|nr:MATE family efflux transporter [Dehalococcoidales bacterium]
RVMGQALGTMLVGVCFHLGLSPALVIGLATAAAIALGVLEFLLLYFFPEPIFRVFTRDGDLIAKASYIAKIAFFALPVFGFFNVGSMVFPSVGRALATFVVSVTRPVAFMIPLLIILPRFFGELGVWACFPGSDVLSTILVLIWLIYLVRELKKEDAVGVVAADIPADAPLKAK